MPMGFRRLHYSDYLDGRGFTSEQYDIFGVGMTDLHPKFRDHYILFSVVEEGIVVGYLGRYMASKEEIEILEASGSEVFRYRNSSSDFAKLLAGIDEVTEDTESVIFVEGIMDKAGNDRNLRLYESPKVKCLCTFGSKFSIEQLAKVYRKGVRNIILQYDPDAVKKIKRNIGLACRYFSVRAAICPQGKDPGDMSQEEATASISNLLNPIEFSLNTI